MFTPQEVQEKTFVKAVFGGYDMQSVDEFLEPLIEDYVTLYKENSVLKSKMKVLVEKLEEYRAQEESMKKAILSAQRVSDEMLAEAEKKAARMLSEAEGTAKNRAVNVQQELAGAEERVGRARQVALDYIAQVERQLQQHLAALDTLRAQEPPSVSAQARRPYDFEQEPDPQPSASDVARQIEQSVGRIVGEEPAEPVVHAVEPAAAPEPAEPVRMMEPLDAAATRVMEPITDAQIDGARFADLKFGRNYDPYA